MVRLSKAMYEAAWGDLFSALEDVEDKLKEAYKDLAAYVDDKSLSESDYSILKEAVEEEIKELQDEKRSIEDAIADFSDDMNAGMPY